jgi:hypothetical protein
MERKFIPVINVSIWESITKPAHRKAEITRGFIKFKGANMFKQVNARLFVFLSTAFFIAVIVGTVSHEGGHYIAARLLGYRAKIGYAYTEWLDSPADRDILWLIAGGPIETFIVGAAGLIMLYFKRKEFYNARKLSIGQWTIIFLSLFWLRQAVNVVAWVLGYFTSGEFSDRGDEIRLARYLNLPDWSITVFTAVISLLAFYWVLSKFIPRNSRVAFLLSGIVGGIAGYIIWLFVAGPVLMP